MMKTRVICKSVMVLTLGLSFFMQVAQAQAAEIPPSKELTSGQATQVAATSLKEMDALFAQWKQHCLDSQSESISEPFFENVPFTRMRSKGVFAVAYFIRKIQQGEKFDFVPGGIFSVMPAVSRTGFHTEHIPTPDKPKLIVAQIKEFPHLEIGRRPGQLEALYWWERKYEVIPVWFKERYEKWKQLKSQLAPDADSAAKATVERAYKDIKYLGIFSVPLWMQKLDEDAVEEKSIIAAISDLTSGEVQPSASATEVKAWWKRNQLKWTSTILPYSENDKKALQTIK